MSLKNVNGSSHLQTKMVQNVALKFGFHVIRIVPIVPVVSKNFKTIVSMAYCSLRNENYGTK